MTARPAPTSPADDHRHAGAYAVGVLRSLLAHDRLRPEDRACVAAAVRRYERAAGVEIAK